MPELEILEAQVPCRTPRLVKSGRAASPRLAPIATWFSGPVFSRARDIFAANMTELLDRSEDPSRMIRMIILEMEETLVEVRASAARSIADIKEMRRALEPARRDPGRLDGQGRAGAVEGPRGPRQGGSARAAEGRRHGRGPARRNRADRSRCCAATKRTSPSSKRKLREARARQNAIAARFESAVTRAKAREIMNGSRTAGRVHASSRSSSAAPTSPKAAQRRSA